MKTAEKAIPEEVGDSKRFSARPPWVNSDAYMKKWGSEPPKDGQGAPLTHGHPRDKEKTNGDEEAWQDPGSSSFKLSLELKSHTTSLMINVDMIQRYRRQLEDEDRHLDEMHQLEDVWRNQGSRPLSPMECEENQSIAECSEEDMEVDVVNQGMRPEQKRNLKLLRDGVDAILEEPAPKRRRVQQLADNEFNIPAGRNDAAVVVPFEERPGSSTGAHAPEAAVAKESASPQESTTDPIGAFLRDDGDYGTPSGQPSKVYQPPSLEVEVEQPSQLVPTLAPGRDQTLAQW
ncbi:uncharacterized protein [Asterias amurensis]|uniref:uncharacterized protein isoform X3 n=1 Tax=Asterias amurensis TaxID=7602 RepID=UPI003AB46571